MDTLSIYLTTVTKQITMPKERHKSILVSKNKTSHEYSSLLGCDAMKAGRKVPTFWRNLLNSYSERPRHRYEAPPK